MRFRIFFVAIIAGFLHFVFVSSPTQAQTCYTANFTLINPTAVEVASVTINFSRGNPFQGTLVVGPVIGQVGPVPAMGQASFKLTGTWSLKPDNIVTSSFGGSYTASIKEGCGSSTSSEPAYVLPGLPTNTQQGFIIPPAEGSDDGDSGDLEIWLVDADGNGYKALTLSQADIDALPEMPEANQAVMSGEGYTLYVLTTGEFQINFGPTADGWFDVVVFNRDFEVTNTYRTR